MALNAFTGSLTINSGASGPIQYTESGLSGGKLLIVTSSNLSATGAASNLRLTAGFGAPGTNELGLSIGANHNSIGSGTSAYYDNQVIAINEVTTRSTANLAQWITGGFELNVSASSDQWTYDYTLLAGTDITDVGMTVIQAPSSNGLVSYTPFTFTPDVLLLGSINSTTSPPALFSGTQRIMLGAATSAAQWACMTTGDVASNLTRTQRIYSDTLCVNLIHADGSVERTASLNAILTNGFQFNWLAGTRISRVAVVGIKGGNPKVGTILQPIVNGIQSVSMGMQPVAGFIAGVATANNSITTGGKMQVGHFSANAQRGHAIQDDHAVTDTASRRGRALSKTKVIQNISWSGTAWQEAGPSSSLSALTGTGIDLQWFDTDATQRKHGYVAFGGVSAPPVAPNKGSLFRTSLIG